MGRRARRSLAPTPGKVESAAATNSWPQWRLTVVLYKTPPYNAVIDFAPVGLLLEQPIVLLARKDLPATTLQEFAAYTKVHQKACNTAPAAPGRLIILLAHDSTRHLATTSCMSPIAARRQCRICWPDASTVDSLRSKRTLFR
jgi:hypothetical protein